MNHALPEFSQLHPRPQYRRQNWQTLNGEWRFCFDPDNKFQDPTFIKDWAHKILVPFAPETIKSGLHDTNFHSVCWYERDFEAISLGDDRLLLHFGAVDYVARVWVNNQFVGVHEGGHTPFTFDITHVLNLNGTQKVTVRVEDDPLDLAKPRGKQDWQREPHSIWYPRTTGIWQTVWLEPVPLTYIDRIRWTPHLERWEIGFEAFLSGSASEGMEIRVRLTVGEQLLVNDCYQAIQGEVHRRIALSDPGIDDFRNELLWSPERPTLIQALIELWKDGICLDLMRSYTALRSVGIQNGDFLLNGRPFYMRLVLDQGYWPESLMTAPDPSALRKDVELAKSMGFNGVRKHQKIEDPQFLFWADVLGLLVWEEMPSAYRFTHESVERIIREWIEVIDRDSGHPCIVVWVPFNESWGVPDLAEKASHRNCVQALYHLTKTLDPTRPVVGNDGWESTATDIIGIHDYDNHCDRLKERYGSTSPAGEILGRRGPAGRLFTLQGHGHTDMPVILTEFGGIAYSPPATLGSSVNNKAWGYGMEKNHAEFQRKFIDLMGTVQSLKFFRGLCYTQFTDTFQEANGLLTAERIPKIDLRLIRAATLGLENPLGFYEDRPAAPMENNQ